jgi:hypothetical protein
MAFRPGRTHRRRRCTGRSQETETLNQCSWAIETARPAKRCALK